MKKLILFFLLTGCFEKETEDYGEKPVVERPIRKGKCSVLDEEIEMNYGPLKFPNMGKAVLESHLMIGDETMDKHLSISSAVYPYPKTDVFKTKYDKEWTPAEGGGAVGQGSREQKPSLEEEVFRANLYFKKNRPLGEKWIIRRGEKTIVVDVSHELGPPKKYGMLGVSSEVLHYIGGLDNVWVGRLIDSSLNLGPIDCEIK